MVRLLVAATRPPAILTPVRLSEPLETTTPRRLMSRPSRLDPSATRMPLVSACVTSLWPKTSMRPLAASSSDDATATPCCRPLPSVASAAVPNSPSQKRPLQNVPLPVSSRLPPAVCSVEALIRIEPAPLLAAVSVIDNAAPWLRRVAPSSTMLRSASSVNDTGDVGATSTVAFSIRMSPASKPLDEVLMLTLLPASSAASIVEVRIVALLPMAKKSGPPPMLLSPSVSLIVMSHGSSSHRPARPRAASVRTWAGRASSQPPEVSMKPPLPPKAPPRALSAP